MMHCDAIIDDDTFINCAKGNEIIESLVSCLTGKGLTLRAAKYLLDETIDELELRTQI